MERAVAFYEKVFKLKMERHPMGELDMAWFPRVEDGTGIPGPLIHYPAAYKPSTDGVLVYSTAHSGDLANELSRLMLQADRFCREKH